MLSQLYIKNIAVIESASVDFKKGMNVFTGETGAGKSILIDSVNAVLGGRASRELIRTGEEKASVKALFSDISNESKNKIIELGYDPDENGDYLISRELNSDGKSVCKVNFEPANVSMLKEISSYLIDVHGQHENNDLQKPELHIEYIDSFGNTAFKLKQYKEIYKKYCELNNKINKLSIDDSEKEQKIDILKYQINELESSELEIGEDEELLKKCSLMRNSEIILNLIHNTRNMLKGDEESEGVLDCIDNAKDNMEKLTRYYSNFSAYKDKLNNIFYELDDIENELSSYEDDLDFNPGELEEFESRLDFINRLKRKYGCSIEEMLLKLKHFKEELNQIEFSDDLIKKLKSDLDNVKKDLNTIGEELSTIRKNAALTFETNVKNELQFLNMPNVEFKVKFFDKDYSNDGKDNIEFYISTNLGEPLKPLSKIASGGELSRIMLSIKNVLADKDKIDTLIFDEIDSGISGSAAMKVGIKLKQVSKEHQIICVTHLAQVACHADNHLLITKEYNNEKTFTNIKSLDWNGRINELSRIMGGELTDALKQSAEELLVNSKN